VSGLAHRVVTGLIILNLPCALWAEFTHDEIAETIDAALLVFFAVEIAIRIVLAVKRRRWDAWLAFDAVIVALAVLPFGVIPVVRVARLAHLGRHVAHLRHVTIVRVEKLAHV
jgi:hypothetical protein